MINEIEALLGILIILIIIYFFIWQRSKILGSFGLILTSLALLVPVGNTDYELIAWIGVIASIVTLIVEFAYAKMGASKS